VKEMRRFWERDESVVWSTMGSPHEMPSGGPLAGHAFVGEDYAAPQPKTRRDSGGRLNETPNIGVARRKRGGYRRSALRQETERTGPRSDAALTRSARPPSRDMKQERSLGTRGAQEAFGR